MRRSSITLFLLILAGGVLIIRTISKPEYELIVNYSSSTPDRTGAVKVYKIYANGTLEEVSFPSDTFENVGRNFKYRRQYEGWQR